MKKKKQQPEELEKELEAMKQSILSIFNNIQADNGLPPIHDIEFAKDDGTVESVKVQSDWEEEK